MSSDATYLNDKYKEDILSRAVKTGDNSYHLPTEHIQIKLKPGVELSDWVARWIDHKYRND